VNSSCNVGPTPFAITCLAKGPITCSVEEPLSCSYRLVEWTDQEGLLAPGDTLHVLLRAASTDPESDCLSAKVDPQAVTMAGADQRVLIRGSFCDSADTLCVCDEGTFILLASSDD